MYISNERRGIITPDDVQGAPDLVIEILSPSTAARDRTYKKTIYVRHGVKEYWIVDPEEKMVEVMSLGEESQHQNGQKEERGKHAHRIRT